jgi:hypothetical protein
VERWPAGEAEGGLIAHGKVALFIEGDRTQHAIGLVLPQGCDHRLDLQ